MSIKKNLLRVCIFTTAVLWLSACSALQPQPSALSTEQVGQVVENILLAIDAGDYEKFSVDFSDTMKSALPEDKFLELREMLQTSSGKYASCAAPNLLNNQGYAVYRFLCKFEKEDVTVTVTFKIDGDKVDGLFFDSTNLRKKQ